MMIKNVTNKVTRMALHTIDREHAPIRVTDLTGGLCSTNG